MKLKRSLLCAILCVCFSIHPFAALAMGKKNTTISMNNSQPSDDHRLILHFFECDLRNVTAMADFMSSKNKEKANCVETNFKGRLIYSNEVWQENLGKKQNGILDFNTSTVYVPFKLNREQNMIKTSLKKIEILDDRGVSLGLNTALMTVFQFAEFYNKPPVNFMHYMMQYHVPINEQGLIQEDIGVNIMLDKNGEKNIPLEITRSVGASIFNNLFLIYSPFISKQDLEFLQLLGRKATFDDTQSSMARYVFNTLEDYLYREYVTPKKTISIQQRNFFLNFLSFHGVNQYLVSDQKTRMDQLLESILEKK